MNDKLPYDYRLAETVEDGSRKVTSAPENWIIEGKQLLWPPTGANQKRKKQVAPESDWIVYPCKVLGPPFKNLQDALAKEKTYEQFSNSESEKEYFKKKELKRKHPVLFDSIDANDEFDQIKIKRADELTQNVDWDCALTPMLSDEFSNHYLTSEDPPLIFGEIIQDMIPDSNQVLLGSSPKIVTDLIVANPRETQLVSIPNNQTNAPNVLQSIKACASNQQNLVYNVFTSSPDGIDNQMVIPQSISLFNRNQKSAQKGAATVTKHPIFDANMRNNETGSNKLKVYVGNTGSSNLINQGDDSPKSMTAQAQSKFTIINDDRIAANKFSRPIAKAGGRTINKKKNSAKENGRVSCNTGGDKTKLNKKQDKPPLKMSDLTMGSSHSTIRRNIPMLSSHVELVQSSETVNANALLNSARIRQNPTNAITPSNNLEYLPLIYKELLELKKLYMADRAANVERFNRIETKIEDGSRSADSIDIFAGNDRDSFDSAFPVTQRRNLRELEINLLTEPVYKAKMDYRLKSIGGKKPHLMIRACMRYLIDDSLLQQFTWKGTTDKKPFIKYKQIWMTIRSAVQSRFKKYTDDRFNKYMGEYIKMAKQRHGRKEEATKKKNARNGETDSETYDDDVDDEEMDGEKYGETDEDDNKSEDEDSEKTEDDQD